MIKSVTLLATCLLLFGCVKTKQQIATEEYIQYRAAVVQFSMEGMPFDFAGYQKSHYYKNLDLPGFISQKKEEQAAKDTVTKVKYDELKSQMIERVVQCARRTGAACPIERFVLSNCMSDIDYRQVIYLKGGYTNSYLADRVSGVIDPAQKKYDIDCKIAKAKRQEQAERDLSKMFEEVRAHEERQAAAVRVRKKIEWENSIQSLIK